MKRFILVSFGCLCITLFNRINAQEKEPYVFNKKVGVIGNGKFDYLTIDKPNNHLFITHETAVNIIDITNDSLIATIDSMVGVHSVAIDNADNLGFISNSKTNSLVVFNLKTFKKIKKILLSGKGVDAVAYDPYSKRVFAFNNLSNDASVIDAKTLKQVGKVILPGSPEFAVSNEKGLIYDNIEDKNIIVAIDTKTLKIVNQFRLSPNGKPTPLAIDLKNNLLFTGCRTSKNLVVVDIKTGKKVASVPIGSGVDAIAYDKGTRFIFCANADGTATIIKQNSPISYAVLQTLKTAERAKTMALDPQTHKIYFSAAEYDSNTGALLPDSFGVLIYQ
jgi:YVTN family beta-propeller protein